MVSAALKLSLGEKNIDMVLDFLRDRSMPVYKNGLSHIVSCCGVNICPDKTSAFKPALVGIICVYSARDLLEIL